MNIGERIKEVRESKHLTQSFINTEMDKSTGWLANIEKGRREISARELLQVIAIMGVSMQEFFSGKAFLESYTASQNTCKNKPGRDVSRN